MRWFVAAVTLAALLLLAAVVGGMGLAATRRTRQRPHLLRVLRRARDRDSRPPAVAIAPVPALRPRRRREEDGLYAIVASSCSWRSFFIFAVLVGSRRASKRTRWRSWRPSRSAWRLARRPAGPPVRRPRGLRERETPYEVLANSPAAWRDVLASTTSFHGWRPPREGHGRGGGRSLAARSAASCARSLRSPRKPAARPDRPRRRRPRQTSLSDTRSRSAIRGRCSGCWTSTMPANDPMNPQKERLVRDVAGQAGLVLRNVGLLEDVRESRRRIVAAQDERARDARAQHP